MRKYLLIILAIFSVAACNPRTKKKKTKSGPINRFMTFHNTLFNSREAFLAEMESRDKSHIDHFYDPYISVYTTEDNISDIQNGMSSNAGNDTDMDAPRGLRSNQNFSGNFSSSQSNKKGATALQITEAKALKTISKYSVLVSGVEKNKKIFDAYMLLAKARMYQGKYLESLDALSYIFNTMSKDKRLPLAKIYQAANYSKMKEYYRADEVFRDLEEDPKIKLSREQLRILKVYQADNFLKWGKKELAAEVLKMLLPTIKIEKQKAELPFSEARFLLVLGKNQKPENLLQQLTSMPTAMNLRLNLR